MKEQRLEVLFRQYLQKRLTDAEETELFQLWLDPFLESRRTQLLDDLYDGLPEDKDMPAAEIERVFQQIVKKQTLVHRLPVKKGGLMWSRVAVAASVLLLVGLGAYFFLFNKEKQPQETVQASLPNDIGAPKTNRAMITLANGQTIYLDSAANGSLTVQGTVKLVKLEDGKIAYESTGASSAEVSYNTLFNPRGSRIIDIMLADGSRVWLNAGSGLQFPSTFTGAYRKVILTGEAYFEVAKNPAKPFTVKTYKDEITVKGTSFNVNSYRDEPDTKTSLLEGLVEINHATLLKPGYAYTGNRVIPADLDKELAWKNGVFNFHHVKLRDAMRQIARWYDVDIRYEDSAVDVELGGEIGRNLTLQQLLNGLQDKDTHFRLEGKMLTVY